jgi:tetratricopeptide (TPR) repeat protein
MVTPEEALRSLRLKVEWSGFPPLSPPRFVREGRKRALVKCYRFLLNGRTDDALDVLTALNAEIDDETNVAALSNLVAYCRMESGDHETAKGVYMQAMSAGQRLAHPGIQMDALTGISVTEASLGEFGRARHIVLHGMGASVGGDDVQLATLKRSLAFVERSANRPDDALGPLDEALRLFREAGDDIGAAWTLFDMGLCHRRVGRFPEAVDSFRSSVEAYEALRCPAGESKGLIQLGAVEELRGNVEEGFDILNRALAIAEEADYKPGIALCLNNIGVILNRRGMYERAIENFKRAHRIAGVIGDVSLESGAINNLGNVYYDLGELDLAKESYKAAIQSQRHCRNEEILVSFLGNLGLVYLELGQFRKSASSLEEAVFLFSRIGNRFGEAVMLSNLAAVYIEVGKYKKGIGLCERALSISRDLDAPEVTSETLSNLGYAHSRTGDSGRAGAAFWEALELLKGVGEPVTQGQILVQKALAEADAGELDRALATTREALGIYEKLGQTNKVTYCQSLLARLHALVGQGEEAARLADRAEPRLEGMPDSVEKLRCRLNLGAALRIIADHGRAYGLLRSAYLGFFGMGAAPGAAQSLGELGLLARETGNLPQAAAYLSAAIETLDTFEGRPPEKEPLETALAEVRAELARENKEPAAFDPANPPGLDL